MIGGSGMAGGWINNFTNNFSDRIEIVGLADVSTDVLTAQSEALGLSDSQLFTDFNEACATVESGLLRYRCSTAISQSCRDCCYGKWDAGLFARSRIADTLDAAKAMVRTSQKTGLPCAIIQNYRYADNKQELIRIRDEGRLGRLSAYCRQIRMRITAVISRGVKHGDTIWISDSCLKAPFTT